MVLPPAGAVSEADWGWSLEYASRTTLSLATRASSRQRDIVYIGLIAHLAQKRFCFFDQLFSLGRSQ